MGIKVCCDCIKIGKLRRKGTNSINEIAIKPQNSLNNIQSNEDLTKNYIELNEEILNKKDNIILVDISNNKKNKINSNKQEKYLNQNLENQNNKNSKNNNDNKKLKKIFFNEQDILYKGEFLNFYRGLCHDGKMVIIKMYNKISKFQKDKIFEKLDYLYKLDHKNIIKIIKILDYKTNNFGIVYEYFQKITFEDIIKFNINEYLMQNWIKQLLEVLQYLHENKIYHRNLNPSEVIISDDGIIKIENNLIDNLINENPEDIYNILLKSDKINYYAPPFFIKAIKDYKKPNQKNIINKDNINKIPENKINIIFEDWKSYDLWCLGCLIIETFSKKKPWADDNFKNNSEFFEFLEIKNSIPIIPKNISPQCQELIKILLDYSSTKKPNIYDIIYELDFFKLKKNNFIDNPDKSKSLKEDSNKNSKVYINTESERQFGHYLKDNKVINILNSIKNAYYTITFSDSFNLTPRKKT